MADTPQILKAARFSNCYSGDGTAVAQGIDEWLEPQEMQARRRIGVSMIRTPQEILQQLKQVEAEANMSQRRIVKVYVADPNPNVPIGKALLFEGTEQLTDLSDQELFFEIPLREKLEAHNRERVTFLDKEQTQRFGKEIKLEPAKIRDLRMVVVDVAKF